MALGRCLLGLVLGPLGVGSILSRGRALGSLRLGRVLALKAS